DVLEVAKIAIGGDSATDVLEGQRRFAIFVRLKEDYRNQVEKLGDILVAAPIGGKIPLGQLASFKLSSGDSLVTRENSSRREGVMCNVKGCAIGGVIAVFGVAVQNGMVMVSFINKLRSRGYELHDAVITGASVRLRAELLSALIGSISLIPFIISSGTGAEIEKPLAIVVVGGLVTRPIKIVMLPMIYEWVERRAERRAAGRSEATLVS